ncbi:MAG: asparagine synthase (glutamine-hydrolyzing) [Bacteroidales bacterium]|nr:asparagine synthase (glutamine-hydrolyzing) [Bacteroidales bacterium]
MSDKLTQRGPDAEGFYCHKNVGLGHRRLSVIDVSSGNQPIFNEDKSIAIVFNGEIYNFQELKQELQQKGHTFYTQSDTEVIIHGYEEFGIERLLNMLEGMFAFAIYDSNADTLFIARDKFGEKPLYYFQDDSAFFFASELKAINPFIETKHIDPMGLNLFLSLSYIPAPYTIYKGAQKLKQGHYLSIHNFESQDYKYYDILTQNIGEKYTDIEACKTDLRNLLENSVKQRMVADVPVGAFLSGGIDSSIIATLMSRFSEKPINTFTIGFREKEYDESMRAQVIADRIKSEHTVHYLGYQDALHILDDIISYYDEPFGDSSAIPSFFVAKLAKEKVDVVLTGDCADELFGGYDKYLAPFYVQKFNNLPLWVRSLCSQFVNIVPHSRFTNVLLRKMKKVIRNAEYSDFDLHYSMMCLSFSDKERRELLTKDWNADIKPHIKNVYDHYQNGSMMEKGFYTDLKVVLEGDMFVKTDRVSMMNSLETRAPFIASSIAEMAYRMPVNFKINGKQKKFILKEAFKDILPPQTLRFAKAGFGVPVDHWFRKDLKDGLIQMLSKEFVEQQGLFNYAVVQKIVDEHLRGKENHKNKLWNLFVFQKWYMKNIV